MNISEPEVDPNPNINTDVVLDWSVAIIKGVVTSEELSKRNIIERKIIIGNFCRDGDLGFIFAQRGIGKSWLGIYMAKCLALGKGCKAWEVKEARKTLYLDGEMNASDVKFRDYALGDPTGMLSYMNHEILFEESGRVMNLADKEFQETLLDYCLKTETKVLFLDNLSTLAVGIDENDGMDWEKIAPFLMKLRRKRVTVIFVHHAGRGNQMRGHSKREDPSAWIIRLDLPQDPLEEHEGAHFLSRFTKWRNASKMPASLEWMFRPNKDGGIDIKIETASNFEIFRQLVQSGVDNNKDIAAEMNVSAAYVSQIAKKGETELWVKISGKKYQIIEGNRHYSVSRDP